MSTITKPRESKVGPTNWLFYHIDKKMLKILLLFPLVCWLLATSAFGQTKPDTIEELVALSGARDGMRQVVAELVNYHKASNYSLPDHFWDSLIVETEQAAWQELSPAIKATYQQVFTEREIVELISLYRSEAGRLMVEKQPQIAEQLQQAYVQWSHNVGNYIIEQVQNGASVAPRADEMTQFKKQFEVDQGWEIVNFDELLPDQRNEGAILVDFGSLSGEEDVTRMIVLRNVTDSTGFLVPPPVAVPSEEITYAWSAQPVAPGDTTAIRITFNAARAEGNGYQSRGIQVGGDGYIQIGVKYEAPYKRLKYQVNDTTLPAKKIDGEFSAPYRFRITNTGVKDFHLASVTTDRPIAYVNYPDATVKPGEEAQVSILFSRALMKQHEVEKIALEITIGLAQGEKDGSSLYTDEQVTLSIR